MKKLILLIDIDGTVSEDIKNEERHLFITAKVLPGALERCNSLFDSGHEIHFFTARESRDRAVTEEWLRINGFKYHSLITDKPRIKDGEEYMWIDNRKVRAITFNGIWSEFVESTKKIFTFKD